MAASGYAKVSKKSSHTWKHFRVIFGTQSNIYDGDFLRKLLTTKVVNYFNNEVPSRMFDWVLNVRLCTFNTWRVFKKTCSLFGFSLNLFLGGFFSYCFSKYGFHKRLCMNREIKHRLKSRD